MHRPYEITNQFGELCNALGLYNSLGELKADRASRKAKCIAILLICSAARPPTRHDPQWLALNRDRLPHLLRVALEAGPVLAARDAAKQPEGEAAWRRTSARERLFRLAAVPAPLDATVKSLCAID